MRSPANETERTKAESRSSDDEEDEDEAEDRQAKILLREDEILQSKKNYNNITILRERVSNQQDGLEVALFATVSLCRVILRLPASGSLLRKSGQSERETVEASASTALTISMRLLKAEIHLTSDKCEVTFLKVFLKDSVGALVRKRYLGEYADIRFYTFKALSNIFANHDTSSIDNDLFNSIFDMLSYFEDVPSSAENLCSFCIDLPKKKPPLILSLHQQKNQCQSAWVAEQLLEIMAESIAPWFVQPERLMGFLTDSYNAGGSLSPLALSGVFLRPPDLSGVNPPPASLVASFIKGLARLCLITPPSAIVAIIPWIYNLLKRDLSRAVLEGEGMDDLFSEKEEDPMQTQAIDSCLWEIAQLQSHYHPNVATIAKIISGQFTKQWYNMEDFLDHSYQSLVDAELSKSAKKSPSVEFMIPKRVFLPSDPASGVEDNILVNLWEYE
ncbi:nucleolar complex protein [Ustulina deusta]|nr:nucleolar complex protein [Ustulina deusta]